MAMVMEVVLDRSEGRSPNKEELQDHEERVDGRGFLICVALLWALLLDGA